VLRIFFVVVLTLSAGVLFGMGLQPMLADGWQRSGPFVANIWRSHAAKILFTVLVAGLIPVANLLLYVDGRFGLSQESATSALPPPVSTPTLLAFGVIVFMVGTFVARHPRFAGQVALVAAGVAVSLVALSL
jgi:hypothetical protein